VAEIRKGFQGLDFGLRHTLLIFLSLFFFPEQSTDSNNLPHECLRKREPMNCTTCSQIKANDVKRAINTILRASHDRCDHPTSVSRRGLKKCSTKRKSRWRTYTRESKLYHMPSLGLMMNRMGLLSKLYRRSAIDASLTFVANISGVQLDMDVSFYESVTAQAMT
jgi:hypothetical protein